MTWGNAAELVIVWWALSVPAAIVVGRLLGRAGDACPAAPTHAVWSDRGEAVAVPLGNRT